MATYTQGNATVILSYPELTQEERETKERYIENTLHQYGKDTTEGRKNEKED